MYFGRDVTLFVSHSSLINVPFLPASFMIKFCSVAGSMVGMTKSMEKQGKDGKGKAAAEVVGWRATGCASAGAVRGHET